MKFRSPGQQPLHIALTSGHTLVIPPEGVEVSDAFRREAIARGAEPMVADSHHFAPALHSGGESSTRAEGGEGAGNYGQETAEKRLELIKDALRSMLNGANEEDFTAAGLPNLKRLQFLAGFNVPRAEADAAWALVQAEEVDK